MGWGHHVGEHPGDESSGGGRLTSPVTVGLVLPTFPQRGPLDTDRLREVIVAAEQRGVDALWACDHLFWHGPVLEALTALAVAATLSSRPTLGTAVLQLPLRPTPLVAKQVAGLQELSGGRIVLGVGAGAHEREFHAVGADFTRRGRAVDDALDELDRLWRPSTGRYAQHPVPARVPVWIGGSSNAAVRRAGRRGDGWIPLFLSPDGYRERSRQLDVFARRAGRRPEDVTRAVLLFVRTGPDGDAARVAGLDWMSSLYGLPAARFERHLVAGAPDDCIRRIAAYVRAGARHLCLFAADDDPLPHLDALIDGLRALGAPHDLGPTTVRASATTPAVASGGGR